jgi:hypothetical protein
MATQSADVPRFLHPLSRRRKILPEKQRSCCHRTGKLVNNVFICLAALVAVLAHPGIAFARGGLQFANHGVVSIAASSAPA